MADAEGKYEPLVELVSAMLEEERLRRFVRQSNAIERIEDDQDEAHLKALRVFLALKRPTLVDVRGFVGAVAPHAKLRERRGRDVHTRRMDGSIHHYPPGSRELPGRLEELLEAIGQDVLDPTEAHAAFEALHPFTDGNGRVGRALWAWHMLKLGRDPFALPFLQHWYYDTLELARRASTAP